MSPTSSIDAGQFDAATEVGPCPRPVLVRPRGAETGISRFVADLPVRVGSAGGGAALAVLLAVLLAR